MEEIGDNKGIEKTRTPRGVWCDRNLEKGVFLTEKNSTMWNTGYNLTKFET